MKSLKIVSGKLKHLFLHFFWNAVNLDVPSFPALKSLFWGEDYI